MQTHIVGATYRLLFFANAFEISSIFIEPMSPKASTSSMCLLMTYNSVSNSLCENRNVANLNTDCS